MTINCQQICDIGSDGVDTSPVVICDDTSVSAASRARKRPTANVRASVERRRVGVSDLIGDRPLSARSVLASALLGADQPVLSVAELIAVASLFGISSGAARTCLWRMVATGELTSDNGSYALAGHLLERRERVDAASRTDDTTLLDWDGTWELAVVSLGRRSAGDRLGLRKAATALHLAELREGIWIRPDNLSPTRLPTSRAVLDRQCVHFHRAATDMAPKILKSLFSLDVWAHDATRLINAMDEELNIGPPKENEKISRFTYEFALSIAVVRHLQLDPLLPDELLPTTWPARTLRSTYRRLDDAFKSRMTNAFRQKA